MLNRDKKLQNNIFLKISFKQLYPKEKIQKVNSYVCISDNNLTQITSLCII